MHLDLTKTYVHIFDLVSEHDQERSVENYYEPWVAFIKQNSGLTYNKTREEREEELKTMPLTFEILTNGNIRWHQEKTTSAVRTIEYSKDSGETWSPITSATGNAAPSIAVVAGDSFFRIFCIVFTAFQGRLCTQEKKKIFHSFPLFYTSSF